MSNRFAITKITEKSNKINEMSNKINECLTKLMKCLTKLMKSLTKLLIQLTALINLILHYQLSSYILYWTINGGLASFGRPRLRF